MIKVLFICHGNICRSPMAEFLLKDMIKKEGLADRFVIASAGTSREEIGNPVHQGTRKKLAQDHISAAGKYAVQLTKEDYHERQQLSGTPLHFGRISCVRGPANLSFPARSHVLL